MIKLTDHTSTTILFTVAFWYPKCIKYKNFFAAGFPSESDEAEDSDEGAGGLESDEEEEGKDRLLNAKEGDEDNLEGRKRTSSEGGGSQRKKKKSRQIVESDEDSD